MIDLDKLEELAAKATPGPWVLDPVSWRGNLDGAVLKYDDHEAHGDCSGHLYIAQWSGCTETPNAAYIAAVDPTTILALIRAVRATRAVFNSDGRTISTCRDPKRWCEYHEAFSAFAPEKNT